MININWPNAERKFLEIKDGPYILLKNKSDCPTDFLSYSIKFRLSARMLVNEMLSGQNNFKLDFYFFSVAFLYRHSMELIIKAIAFSHINKHSERAKFIKDNHHDLKKLLESLDDYIKIETVKDNDAYDWLKMYISDLRNYDVESDSFRYPFSIKSYKNELTSTKEYTISSLFENQTHINLLAFAEKCEIALEMFEDIYNRDFGKKLEYKSHVPIFLETGGSYYAQSVVGYKYDKEKYHPYVTSYEKTAEFLFQSIILDENTKDTLFLPMCYLYRNLIELLLKENLVEESKHSFSEAMGHIQSRKHSLVGIWNIIKEEIEEHGNAPEEDETLDIVENYISQIHSIDGISSIFRYPYDKNLNCYYKNPRKLDIKNVGLFFSELTTFLSAANGLMNYHNEIRAEIEAEYRSYYREWE